MTTNTLFSIYKAPITNIFPYDNITIQQAAELVRGDLFAAETAKLRGITDKKQQDDFKKYNFQYVTWGGVFSKRSEAGLIKRSQYIVIDLDNLPPGSIPTNRERILSLITPTMLFVSLRGNGLKIVYSVNTEDGNNGQYFDALANYFKNELHVDVDKSGRDISRACFLCHDANVYFEGNEAAILDRAFLETFSQQPVSSPAPPVNVFSMLVRWLDKSETFATGNRNRYVSRLAYACNRFGIPEGETLHSLLPYAENGFSDTDIKAIVKSVYKHTNQHGTAKLREPQPQDFEAKTQEKQETCLLMPLDGWPDPVKEMIEEGYRIYGGHRDIWCAAFLAATAAAIGQSQILKTKYENAPLFWLAVVARSGIGKTEPFKLLMDEINNADHAAYEAYQKEMQVFEAAKANLKKGEKASGEKQPVLKQTIVQDTSPEKLYQHLYINPRGITINREELKGWLLDFGRYNKSGEVEAMLSIWSQAPFKIDRVSSGTHLVKHPFVSVVGGLQLSALKFMAKDDRDSSGFLPRFCFVFPEKVEALEYNNNELSPSFYFTYRSYIRRLLDDSQGVRNENRLTQEAAGLYEEFYNKNAKLNNSDQPDFLNEVNSKLNIIVLRVALVYHISRWAITKDPSAYISGETMKSAIATTEYFRRTQQKVYDFLREDPAVMDNKNIAKYLFNKCGNQTYIAKAMGISQPAVYNLLKR